MSTYQSNNHRLRLVIYSDLQDATGKSIEFHGNLKPKANTEVTYDYGLESAKEPGKGHSFSELLARIG
ncbi:hypothetical protein CPB85DRAFT_1441310 [Mucidula mucida]|nr:hypothetical protein CPB85DRAFT_1441310 [Mucidula mucida]